MNGNTAYLEGLKNMKKQNISEARSNFKVALDDPQFQGNALRRLVELDLKEGNYKNARKLLTEKSNFEEVITKFLYGRLELCEYNIQSSQQYYKDCLLDVEYQERSLLAIGQNHLQLGDYKLAKKILETFVINPQTREVGLYNLIYLAFLEENYREADVLLQQLFQACQQDSKSLSQVYCAQNFLKYCTKTLNPVTDYIDPNMHYKTYRLYYNDDEAIINHLQRHKEGTAKYQDRYFFKYLDLKELLYDVKSLLDTYNPLHITGMDKYRMRLDTPIGFQAGEITYDLEVVAMMKTKEIITMYPILLSDEFDREGFSTDMELKEKRKGKRL